MNIRYAKEKDLDYIIKCGHVKDRKIIMNKIKNKEFIVAEDKDLIGFYDYGQGVVLQSGETLTIDFDGSNGIFQSI